MENHEIISNWYDKTGSTNMYSLDQSNLSQIVNEYKTNLKAFKNIRSKLDKNIPNGNYEIDYVDLNDCLLFLNLNENGYNLFDSLVKEFGYISVEVNHDTEYNERSYLSFDKFYALFSNINTDDGKRPLFTGISKIEYNDGGHYIGSIVDNKRQGFGTCYYYNEFNFDESWNGEIGTNVTWEEFKIFYTGHWINDKKHGLGILGSYESPNYDYTNYYLLGKWENDKLVKIYKLNKCQWLDMKYVINEKKKMYSRFSERDDSDIIDDSISFNNISIVTEEFNTLRFPELIDFSKYLRRVRED